MDRRKIHFQDGRMGSALAIKIIPNSRNNKVKSILDDGTLIIELRIPNTKEGINSELINFLAELFDVTCTEIEIVGGEDGIDKLVAILDVGSDELERRIMTYRS